MALYKEIEGDLIQVIKSDAEAVAVHGCNCFCLQGAGIAWQFAHHFGTHRTPLEAPEHRGDINKLGNIEAKVINKGIGTKTYIVNAYTQYEPGANLDYNALALCLKKINHKFKGKDVYLPKIGCGIGGGDWEKVKKMIQTIMIDCTVIVVIYKPEEND